MRVIDMNDIIFLLGAKNTYNNLVYNTLNGCIDASTMYKHEINWKIPKFLNTIHHSSNNENNYGSGPLLYNINDGYWNSEHRLYQKESLSIYLSDLRNTSYIVYRPCISIHE